MNSLSSSGWQNCAHQSSANMERRVSYLEERRTSYLEEAILSPGNVEINVQGAFIAEEENHWIDGMQRDTRDIRLPNHKTVVSHVALDVKASEMLRPTSTNAYKL